VRNICQLMEVYLKTKTRRI